jgi:hypothetical protein
VGDGGEAAVVTSTGNHQALQRRSRAASRAPWRFRGARGDGWLGNGYTFSMARYFAEGLLTVAICLAPCLAARRAAAEDPPVEPPAQLRGERVRVESASIRGTLTGLVIGTDRDAIDVEPEDGRGESRRITLGPKTHIEVFRRTGSNARVGALVGAVIGSLLVAVPAVLIAAETKFCSTENLGDCPNPTCQVALVAGLGLGAVAAGVGAGIGAALGTTSARGTWEPLRPSSRIGVMITPARGREAGRRASR